MAFLNLTGASVVKDGVAYRIVACHPDYVEVVLGKTKYRKKIKQVDLQKDCDIIAKNGVYIYQHIKRR